MPVKIHVSMSNAVRIGEISLGIIGHENHSTLKRGEHDSNPYHRIYSLYINIIHLLLEQLYMFIPDIFGTASPIPSNQNPRQKNRHDSEKSW